MVKRISRREFLAAAAGTTFALVTGCSTDTDGRLAPTIAAPGAGSNPADSQGAVNGGASSPSEATHADLWLDDIFITPTDVFYLQHYRFAPELDAAPWSLTIDGLVDNPRVLSYDDILAMPSLTKMRSLECIGNPHRRRASRQYHVEGCYPQRPARRNRCTG